MAAPDPASRAVEAPRVRPEHAVRPGTGDARRLLIVWFVRKSFYPLLAIGLLGAIVTGRVDDVSDDVASGSLAADLFSPMAGLALALLVRFGSGLVALWLAYPLALSYDVGLSPRTGVGSGIGKLLDRLQLARAFRALRWTHHVRQVALVRLGPSKGWVAKVDPVMDITNISLWVFAVLAALVIPAVS